MKRIILVMALLILIVSNAYADYWKQKDFRWSATAGATLATGDTVTLDTTGEAEKADADNTARRPCVGLIDKGGAAAAKVEVVMRGILYTTDLTSQTPGSRVFLSETAGGMTTDTSGLDNEQPIGFVRSSTSSGSELIINVQMPDINGAGY